MNVCVVIDGEERTVWGVFSSFDMAVEAVYNNYCERFDYTNAQEDEKPRSIEDVREMIARNRGWGFWQFIITPLDKKGNVSDTWFEIDSFDF